MNRFFKIFKANRNIISLIAILIIGITFIVSGTGKLIGLEEVSAQVVGFINAIIPSFMLTSGTVYFLYHVFIPYLFPLAEFLLGLFILIGFVPRLIAVLYLPLLASFLGTNIWSIVEGGYSTCADCFGIWEKVFGSLTPAQSLIYDIVMVCCALAIIFLYPGKFLSSRQWLKDFFRRSNFFKIRDFMRYYCNLKNILPVLSAGMRRFITTVRVHPLNTVIVCFCIICVGLGIYGLVILFNTGSAYTSSDNYELSNLAVSEITDTTATISWTTDSMTITSLQLYDEKTASFRVITDKAMQTVHNIQIDNLIPETRYYFLILYDGVPDYDKTTTFTFFQTLPASTDKPVISDLHINYVSENDVIVTWSTNKPTTGEIEYWLSDSEHKGSSIDETLSISHSIQLTMLEPDATYNFIVKSTDENGNEAISNGENTFTVDFGSQIGKRAPDFTLQTIDGQNISLSDYSGKCVMLNFWMVSCPTCRHKIPYIQEAFDKLPSDQVTILNIHTGGREDVIYNFIESEKLTIPILLDLNRDVTSLYSVTGVPTTFFIDRSGIIRMIDEQFSNADDLLNILGTLCSE